MQERCMPLEYNAGHTRRNARKSLQIAKRSFQSWKKKKTVKLYILDSGLSVDNYNDRKEVVFNWLEYKDKISQDVFIDFLNNVDYSKLPKGITFKIRHLYTK